MRLANFLRLGVCVLPLLSGCGGDEAETSVLASAPGSAAGAASPTNAGSSITSEVATVEVGGAESEETDDFIPPFPENEDPFSPPTEMPIVEPEPEPEIEEPVKPNLSLPPLRLLGFLRVGEPRAILSVDGERKMVAPGDVVRGVKIMAVNFPVLQLQHRGSELALNLFEQKWENMPGGKRQGVAAEWTGTDSGPRRAPQTDVRLPQLPAGPTQLIPDREGGPARRNDSPEGPAVPDFPEFSEPPTIEPSV